MFGSLAFMVNDRMVVAVGRAGDLLVRADPTRNRELVARPGATPAEMGAGRLMGPSWISVDGHAIATDEELSSWVGVALEHNHRAGGAAR